MQAQPTFEFSAILAAIIGTLWVSVPTPSQTTRAAVTGPGGELRSGRVVESTTSTNFLHATLSGSPSAHGIERRESLRQGSPPRREHHAASFQHPAWAIELGRRESRNMDDAIGDHGRSHGRFQFTKETWDYTTTWRAKHGLATYSFKHAHNQDIATNYAVSLAQINGKQFEAKFGRQPTAEETMAMHRFGFHGFCRSRAHQVSGQGNRR